MTFLNPSVAPTQRQGKSRAALAGSRADPLSANVQGYSQNDVERVMRAGSAIFRPRFELYDSHRNLIDPALDGITGAKVSWDETRAIKGSLDLTFVGGDTRLREAPFQYLIKPYAGVGPMPDGGIAEFPMGVFVWVRPKRNVLGVTGVAEEWTVTLGDQLHILQVDGPVTEPFEITAGVPITDHISYALYLAGFDAYGDEGLGITYSDAPAASSAWYGFMTTAKQDPFLFEWQSSQPQTWLDILNDLHGSLGYQRPHFNKNGLYRACPDRAWADEGPDVIYDTKDDGVALVPVTEEPDFDKIANRVVAYRGAQEAPGGWYTSFADLNWFLPQHPLAQCNTGRYITRPVNQPDLPFASSDWAMYELAVRDLFERLAWYEKVTLKRVGFLAQHEAYQIVGIDIANDWHLSNLGQQFAIYPDVTAPIPLYRETAWETDLFTGESSSTLAKLLRTVNF